MDTPKERYEKFAELFVAGGVVDSFGTCWDCGTPHITLQRVGGAFVCVDCEHERVSIAWED